MLRQLLPPSVVFQVNLTVAFGADLLPGGTGVGAAVDAFQRARVENVRIGGRLRQGVDGLPREPGGLSPGVPAVVAHPQAAIGAVLPRAHENRGGVRGVDYDAVEHETVGRIDLGQPAPGRAAIFRLIEPAVGGAQVKMIGIARIRGKGARVAARGADHAPRRPCGQAGSRKSSQGEKGETQHKPEPEETAKTKARAHHACRKLLKNS